MTNLLCPTFLVLQNPYYGGGRHNLNRFCAKQEQGVNQAGADKRIC
jgi:hypothetical protein